MLLILLAEVFSCIQNQAATINAANLLGVTDRAELKAGKLADIIAVEGNPLTDIRVMERVKFVMKDGEVVKAD